MYNDKNVSPKKRMNFHLYFSSDFLVGISKNCIATTEPQALATGCKIPKLFYKSLVFSTLFAFFLSSALGLAKAEIPMGADRFKSLWIEYKIEGEHQSGRETFIQKEKKTSRETHIITKVLYQQYEEHNLEIDDGDFFYCINLIDKTGIKIPSINKLKEQMVESNPHLYKTGQLPSPLHVTPSKGKLEKTEMVQGKECAVYVSNRQVLYIWQDLILKQEWEMVGKSTKAATKLELNANVSDSIFEIPPGILFQDPTHGAINGPSKNSISPATSTKNN
jgi:hypothetical protein